MLTTIHRFLIVVQALAKILFVGSHLLGADFFFCKLDYLLRDLNLSLSKYIQQQQIKMKTLVT